MTLDPTRMLMDSVLQIWKRLGNYGTLEALVASTTFDDWMDCTASQAAMTQVEELQLRRDYHRLCNLLRQIEMLVPPTAPVLELVEVHAVNTQIAERL